MGLVTPAIYLHALLHVCLVCLGAAERDAQGGGALPLPGRRLDQLVKRQAAQLQGHAVVDTGAVRGLLWQQGQGVVGVRTVDMNSY